MRLHIGASIDQLSDPRLESLIASEWVHLGDPEFFEAEANTNGQSPFQARGLSKKTIYVPFYYKKGQTLEFEDESFSFIFSEHFFEHLFLDEAGELFKECHRVIMPGACLRIVVPDADLRTYKQPEPPGYSTGDPRWFHPDKHKTRWSIYSLSYALEEIGFRTRGVVYCDKYGKYHCDEPEQHRTFYKDCSDREFIIRTDYICRFENSLVVDAVRVS